jgi:multidrug resistance efflux pump
MKFNWYYAFVFVLFVSMLVVSSRYFKGSKYSTVGITSAREHKISAEKSALVKNVLVISGQQVRSGDLLVELTSNELEMDIAKLKNHIDALNSELIEKEKLARSEIAFVKADEGIRLEEMNTDIGQAESELALNMRLTKNFLSASDTSNGDPLKLKLAALKKQRTRQEEAMAIRIRDIQQKHDTEQKLISNQIMLLNKEMELHIQEQKSLNKYASGDGLVGNVYVRPGEQVDAFTSLLSINLIHPTTVVGYIVGKKEEMPVGSKVHVQSYEHPSYICEGTVIGYGAVTALPEILQKSTAVKAFGREIFIEIPGANNFASGEKVLVR